MVLYLVRHGRTLHNASRKLLGRLDVPLDEVGVRQAEALGRVDFLRNSAYVVSSPLERARVTASALGPPVVVDSRWTEIDYGVYDGSDLASVPDLWEGWTADLGYAPPGGESLLSVGARVRQACDDVWEEAAKSDVVVVTHVSPLKAAVAWALGVGDEVCWRMFVDVASVSCIGTNGRGPTLRSFNETHLRPSS